MHWHQHLGRATFLVDFSMLFTCKIVASMKGQTSKLQETSREGGNSDCAHCFPLKMLIRLVLKVNIQVSKIMCILHNYRLTLK